MPHPLAPLSAAEIETAVRVIKSADFATTTLKFVTISLHEPTKPADLVFTTIPAREAFAVTFETAEQLIYEIIVDLDAEKVSSRTPIPERFPGYLGDHFELIENGVKADPRWQEAMRKRGVEDFDLCMVDPWPAGYWGDEDQHGTSPWISRPLTFVRSAPGENGYARPVENLIVKFDLSTNTVLEVYDYGVVPLPPTSGNYLERFMYGDPDNRPVIDGPRDGLKEIVITQPDGPSFTVDGWNVTWQKWDLRVGFNAREGLLLHDISYTHRGVKRPILWRAALSEMVVPYGDNVPTQRNKNVFDMGEVGMGFSANSLTLGCDCLGEIYYFDGVVNDSNGNPVVIPNAICMHEEDFGISWKHTDFRSQEAAVRRSRRLVISMICTVGNYEYGFFWYIYTDGSIEYEVKLTGILTTNSIAPGETSKYGNMIAPGLYGPHHQHFFNIRMDMTVDGVNNSVYEVDSLPEEDENLNPWKNAWYTKHTLIDSESHGARDWNYDTNRYWVVKSDKDNELGEKTAFKIEPRGVVKPFVQKGSWIYDRARFVQHPLWVTKYDPKELYAAGDYMYQTKEIQGLPKYVEDDASLENTDVVVWYTVGTHHVVRPEDWPVMPVAYIGFHLKPVGFFDGNPALDVPPSAPNSKHCHG
ncbi:MAG: primary-amine oxidase [Gordonia sp. (in: high G+C Gram-positive bacteria)]